MGIYTKLILETKDKSKVDKDFKKKSGLSFYTIDIFDNNALKYISEKWRQDNKKGIIGICKENDEIAGYCLVNKSGTIAPLRVYDKYRGYGLSEILMKKIILDYKGKKLGVYSDNEIAIKLYKKLGFIETGKKTYSDGEVVLIMELDKKK